MARFQNSVKIASASVLAVVIFLFFRQNLPYPHLSQDGYGNVASGGFGGNGKSGVVYIHDVYSDMKGSLPSDSIPQINTSKPIVEEIEKQYPEQAAEAKQEQELGTKPESEKEGRSDYWSVDHGRMLPSDALTSQNGQYTMNMTLSGELKIYRNYVDIPSKAIFWTNANFQWVGSKYAQMSEDGIFQTWHHIEDGNNGQGPEGQGEQFKEEIKKLELGKVERSLKKRGYDSFNGPFRTWSSIQWPQCQKKPEEGMTAIVVLTDTGALQIKHLRKVELEVFAKTSAPATKSGLLEHICEIFEGEKEVAQGDMGKLAVVLAGTMRSWKRCCKHINEKVLDQWPGSGGVDVFVATGESDVYGYEEGKAIPWLEIQDQLNRCLGGRLRLLEHAPVETETFPDLESTGGKCNSGTTSQHRLINQVKTIYRGGQLVMQYAIRTGTVYGYVLKMRPDHLVWGDSVPPFEPLEADVLKYPMPYWEPPTWSMRHTGIAHSTPSDEMAFGRLLPMMMYFSLFPSYVKLVRTTQEEGAQDYPPCYHPWAPCADSEGDSPCSMEGLSGYWPALNGIKYVLDWRWKVNLLREGEGELSKEWRVPWNMTQGTRYVENGFE